MKHSIPRLAAVDHLPQLGEGARFPFIVVCPQTAQVGDWSNDIPRVKSLVKALARDSDADPARVYATGVSQGAIGSWELAAEATAEIAAIIAVSWKLPRAARDAGSTPAWVLVGGKDPHYDAEAVEQELRALRGEDERTRFSCLPNAKHDEEFWNDVYGRADLYRWLLGHTRT